MSWIESHQGIERHPKTIKLSLAMGWDIDQTIGKLHRLWWWCLDFAPDGNVRRHSADMVAIAIGIAPTDGEKFFSAMYDAEFLDKTAKNQLLIHDWMEYAGRYLKDTKFRRNPEKIQGIIALYSTIVSRQSADKKPTIRRKSAVPTLPTLPNLPTIPGVEVSAFVLPEWVKLEAWEAYETMRKEKKKVPTDNARRLVVLELTKLRANGDDPNEILMRSARSGWTDVYAINKGGVNDQGKRNAGDGNGKSATGIKPAAGEYASVKHLEPVGD